MKKLILLLAGSLLMASCEKVKQEVAKHTLTFDDIKGNYYGSIYEDMPDPSGGVISKLYTDTLSITMVGSEIILTSRAIGTIKATTGKTTASTFQLFIAPQRNGKTDTSGKPCSTGEDASDLTIEKANLDEQKFVFKKDTLGKDPNETPIEVMTRYRVVSLEK